MSLGVREAFIHIRSLSRYQMYTFSWPKLPWTASVIRTIGMPTESCWLVGDASWVGRSTIWSDSSANPTVIVLALVLAGIERQ